MQGNDLNRIRDEQTREAVAEVWKSTTRAIRDIHESIELLYVRLNELEARVSAAETALRRFR